MKKDPCPIMFPRTSINIHRERGEKVWFFDLRSLDEKKKEELQTNKTIFFFLQIVSLIFIRNYSY